MKTQSLIAKITLILLTIVAIDNSYPASMSPIMTLQSPIVYRIDALGIASYYSYECANLPMANGKPFDPERHTCASWFYKFGTVLRVKSLDTGRVTEVVVTDRGPNKRLVKEGRIIDLSRKAFEDICDPDKGLTRVSVAVKI